MSPEIHLPPKQPEWWRSGRFFVIALALHGLVLFYPLQLALGKLDIPEPASILVKLVESSAPQPVVTPPKPMPSAPTPPSPRRDKPVPTPRPVLAMPAEQHAAAATFSVPEPVAPSPAPPVSTPAPSAPAKISAARFDAAYLQNPKPAYPPLSRRLGEEGKVLLKVRVSTDGLAVSVEVEKSSNFDRLDEAARQAVARWRFVPARRGDEAIEASVIVPIVFRLDS